MGILLGLGLLWLVGDLVHKDKTDEAKAHLTLVSALTLYLLRTGYKIRS